MRQGALVATNVIERAKGKTPKPFTYETTGRFVDLGRNKAVADIMGVRFRGFPAWFVGRTYHLLQVPGLSRKVRVASDWTLQLFFARDTAELGALQNRDGSLQ